MDALTDLINHLAAEHQRLEAYIATHKGLGPTKLRPYHLWATRRRIQWEGLCALRKKLESLGESV